MKTKEILKEVLKNVEPPKEDLEKINNFLNNFLKKLNNKISSIKIDAEVFVGGSFAKNTLIKKQCYDIYIFLRFSNKYKDDEISELTGKIIKNITNFSLIHGSRDYFRITQSEDIYFEIIPVIKVKNPKDSKNITDLSYSHVKYINKKLKKNILDEVRIAKAFCHANNSYGAESYIRGFSGYGLELLIYHYKSFMGFIKAVSKAEDKIIIDTEKQFRNKQEILINLNSSKLKSPIILVDPTYKYRNVLAALSDETFEKFKKNCKEFLKNPSIKNFETKKTDLETIKNNAKKKKYEFLNLIAYTDKQEGDIAGSKLLKFSKYLESEIGKNFYIKNRGFEYGDKKTAEIFFVLDKRKEILYPGPFINDKKHLEDFKKKHKKVFVKNKRVYSKEKNTINGQEFIKKFIVKNIKIIKDMSITNLEIKN